MHESSCFITLTYSDKYLPKDYSISIREVQLFMKRLRKSLGFIRVRFFLCGEYGEGNLRPHYHILLFGYDFPDRKLWRKTNRGDPVFRSETLEKIWPYGFSEIAMFSKDAAAYVARYVVKKHKGRSLSTDLYYTRRHPLSGKLCRVKPEFVIMSRKPGLGSSWLERYGCDVFPSDFLVHDGAKYPVPRFYEQLLSDRALSVVKWKRKVRASRHAENQTPQRLAVRQEVLEHKVKSINRKLDVVGD